MVISYILNALVDIIDINYKPDVTFEFSEKIILCITLSIVLTFISICIYNNKSFNKLVRKWAYKSINNNIWQDIVDCEKGTAFKVFLKNKPITYLGRLAIIEEKGIDSWFCLSEYICCYLDTGEQFNSVDASSPSMVALNLKDVERIELFYDKESKIFN